MNSPLLHFSALAFVSLFTMVNPLGVVPVYNAMTASLTPRQSRRVAFRATLTAFLVMVLFALTGQLIFRFFHISLNSLRIVGGALFFLIGYEMLQARLTRTKHDAETTSDYIEDIAITPLGVPMICGPGVITTAVLLMNESEELGRRVALFASMAAVSALTYAFLVSGKRVIAALGPSGNKVLTRLMGLIVMVIAVEFFFAGLTPIVRAMLAPAAG
ncbi:MAG TPA: MarC family protein [Candidatus Eisenbacteria bacterium]